MWLKYMQHHVDNFGHITPGKTFLGARLTFHWTEKFNFRNEVEVALHSTSIVLQGPFPIRESDGCRNVSWLSGWSIGFALQGCVTALCKRVVIQLSSHVRPYIIITPR